MDFLTEVSQRFGSGNVQSDAILVFGTLIILCLVAAIVSLARKSEGNRSEFERLSNLAGRLEKLEMTLNAFRTESLRSIEIFKGDVGIVKQELRELRRALGKGEPPTGSGGGTGQGQEGAEESAAGSLAAGALAEPAAQVELAEEAVRAPIEVIPLPSEVPLEEPRPEALSRRLQKTREGFFSRIRSIFTTKPTVDAEALEEIEAQLVGSDLGAKTATALTEKVREEILGGKNVDESALTGLFKEKILSILAGGTQATEIVPAPRANGPLVVMLVGVNGVGKTTTAAKLADQWKKQGVKVLLVAADTFRAAAVEQLIEWGKRIGVPVVSGAPDAKPATVVFDAMERAKREKFDVLLIDTAGRLHTKTNLMQELEGVRRIMERHQEGAPHEVILVVDGSTGQNALSQAREFNQALRLTGLVVTKLDGTPKGGIVVAIKEELNIPVRYIGVGEGSKDLRPFSASEFVDALFEPIGGGMSSGDRLSAHGETRRRRRREQDQPFAH